MAFITIESVREYAKSDGDDESTLQLCMDAAVAACLVRLNRGVYESQAELDAALLTVDTMIEAAETQRDQLLATIPARSTMRLYAAREAYSRAILEAGKIVNGIVADFDIKAAMVMTAGHYYWNRAINTDDKSAAGMAIPEAADMILRNRRWEGYDLWQ